MVVLANATGLELIHVCFFKDWSFRLHSATSVLSSMCGTPEFNPQHRERNQHSVMSTQSSSAVPFTFLGFHVQSSVSLGSHFRKSLSPRREAKWSILIILFRNLLISFLSENKMFRLHSHQPGPSSKFQTIFHTPGRYFSVCLDISGGLGWQPGLQCLMSLQVLPAMAPPSLPQAHLSYPITQSQICRAPSPPLHFCFLCPIGFFILILILLKSTTRS